MALGDPFQLLLVLGVVILIPVLLIYWIVRFAIKYGTKWVAKR